MSYGLVCCRDTEAEAKALYQRIVDEGDWGATNTIIELMLGENYSYSSNKEEIRAMGERFIAGWGGYPLVGTPEQVVDKMVAIADIGVEGFILSLARLLRGDEILRREGDAADAAGRPSRLGVTFGECRRGGSCAAGARRKGRLAWMDARG